jgi:hypothetical protein
LWWVDIDRDMAMISKKRKKDKDDIFIMGIDNTVIYDSRVEKKREKVQ